jgi:hypothetical protein
MKLTKRIKNKDIRFVVTNHAYQQFTRRISQLHKNLLPYEIVEKFVQIFQEANKLKRRSLAKQIRDEQYEGNTVYYRNKDFNFIVQDNIIITVEFNGKKKHLNRKTKRHHAYA